IRALRAADSTSDIHIPAAHIRSEVKSRPNRRGATPLPAVKHMRKRSFRSQPMIFAKREVVRPGPAEFMPLVKAGEASVGCNVEWILRHHDRAKPDRRRIINRLRKSVAGAEAQP